MELLVAPSDLRQLWMLSAAENQVKCLAGCLQSEEQLCLKSLWEEPRESLLSP